MLSKRSINILGEVMRGSSRRPYFFKPVTPTYNMKKPLTHFSSNRFLQTSSDPVGRFFNIVNKNIKRENPDSVLCFLRNESLLKSSLIEADSYIKDNYIHSHFVSFLSAYSNANSELLLGYFKGTHSFEEVCRDFIKFCFSKDISLNEKETLHSFAYHNQLSDSAVKSEVSKLTPKSHINLLGFGLDEGTYEKSIAEYIIQNGIAKTVTVYGFDPYANKKADIIYLNKDQLTDINTPKFDLITARWVLHHVVSQDRWDDLIHCVNNCTTDARILIVEHGFLKTKNSNQDRKLSDLLNATFDIIANIGLRPRYFTDSLPDLGANFFIQYLLRSDFEKIKKGLKLSEEKIYDVGPSFPNQTICSMRIR